MTRFFPDSAKEEKNHATGKPEHFCEESAGEKIKEKVAQIWDFFAPTVICVFVLIIINTFFIFYAVVPTGSMKNLIQENSYILANRLAYVNHEVERGDVVIFWFESPGAEGRYMVKRVIGVAGDVIELHDGAVYRNGTRLDESEYVLGHTYPYLGRETFTVPEGHILTFGDNRENSSDSRLWPIPYISVDAVKGKVFCSFSILDWYFHGIG